MPQERGDRGREINAEEIQDEKTKVDPHSGHREQIRGNSEGAGRRDGEKEKGEDIRSSENEERENEEL